MKNVLLWAICLATMPVAAFCQNPQLLPEWVNKVGGPGSTVNATGVKADAAGFIYVTGSFTGTADFDPLASVSNLVSVPATTAGFIAKYSKDGALIWAYPLLGSNVLPADLTVTNGAISIIGKFDGAFDADPGLGINTLTGNHDAFVIHLKDDGSFLWAKAIGGIGADIGNKIASDDAGNVYAALLFQSTITVGGTIYTAKGLIDGLLIKYDAAGSVILAIDLGYAGEQNTVSGVAVDKAGNIDIIGYLNGPVNFNPLGVPFAKSATNSIYVAQYLPDGKLNWVNSVEQGFQNNNNNLNIALSGSNEIYIAASFSGTVQFNINAVLHAKGVKDMLVARYTQAGDLSFYNAAGSPGASIFPAGLGVSSDGKYYYLGGSFTGSANFSTNPAPAILVYHGQQDLFLAKYSTANGSLVVANNAGNNSCPASANSLAVVNNDKVLLTGFFCSMVSFGGAACTAYDVTAAGNSDMFLAKYSEPLAITNNVIVNSANCSGGPNLLAGSVPAGGIGSYRYEWQSSTDGEHFTEIPGETGQSYTPPVTGSDIYYIRLVISGECSAYSQSNPIAVGPSNGPVQNNVIDPPVVAEGCFSIATKITGSTPTHGGGVYTYQWQRSSDGVSGWTNLVPLGGNDPDFYRHKDVESVGDNQTFYVRRLVSVPGCAAIPSNVVKLTVYPKLDNILIHATGQTEFCDSGDPGVLVPDREPTGGNGVYTYQWKKSTSNIFVDVVGGTGPTLTPGVLTESTTFVRYVYSGPCYSGDPGMNSNPIIITVKKKITITNTITQPADGVLCRSNADPSNIAGTHPGGGAGVFTTQWQQSTDNVNFENISGANDYDYDPPKITTTTYYRRAVAFTGNTECADISFSASVIAQVATANVTANNIHKSSLDPEIICTAPFKPHTIIGDPAVGSGFTYQWQSSTNGGTSFQDIAGATNKDFDPTEITATIVYHRLAVVTDKCVAPLPSNAVTFSVSATASSNKITALATTVFCDRGDAGIIDGTVVTSTGVHYQWQSSPDGNAGTFTDINQAVNYNYDPPLAFSTVYYRRVVTTDVCNVPQVTDPVVIQVSPTPVVSTSATAVLLCAGDKVTLMASGGTQYKWTPADGLSADNVPSPVASPKTTTTYTVQVSNGSLCTASGSIKVTVVPKPVVSAGADKRVFRGDAVKLDGKVVGDGVHYSWSPTDYLDDPTSLNTTAAPPKTITYTLTATTDMGCSIVTDDVTLNVFEKLIIPNAFTPNGDGNNDLWDIVGLSTYPGNILTVFNRNGAEVFRSVSYAKVWDGTYRGKLLPFGTYYYVIDLKDGSKPMSGSVSLIR